LRVQAIISYDGSKFQGIQSQPHKQTIQDTIESALKRLNIHSKINYAGRTDSGVHALNQSIDFEIPIFWHNLNKLQNSLNSIIQPYIYIKKIKFVDNNFHSRFLATKRSYRYIITNQFTPFHANYTMYKKNLNIDILKQAIKEFEGEHDFEYFSKKGSDVNNYIRKIYKTNIILYKNYVIIKFIGNGFLRSQIRIMVDFLIKISDKKLTIDDLKNQLNKKELISNNLAIPNGLYFEKVWYENINNRR
jgi:tRNA pseudouridine38-40 synthase